MLSMCISSWRIHSVHASVCDAYTQCTHHFLMHILGVFWMDLFKILNFFPYAEHTPKKLMCMLKVCISSCRVCSANASVPDPNAQGTHQFQFLWDCVYLFLHPAHWSHEFCSFQFFILKTCFFIFFHLFIMLYMYVLTRLIFQFFCHFEADKKLINTLCGKGCVFSRRKFLFYRGNVTKFLLPFFII